MNSLVRLVKISVNSLLRNKGRTVLSILGIIIGIATVLVIFSTSEAIKGIITNQVNSFGTDYIQVEVKVPSAAHTSSENASGQAQGVVITTLTIDDAEAIKRLDNVKDYYGGILDQKNLNYADFNKNVFVFGVSPAFIDIDPGEVEDGRFFSNEENEGLSQVVVLGNVLAKNIFGDIDPIGKFVRLGNHKYEVVGVMEKRGANLFFDLDSMAYAPVKTVQKKLLGVDYVSFIFTSVHDNSISEFTAMQITDLLRDRHDIADPNKDDFAVTTASQALDILGNVTGATSILLLLIASISLLVGSVGIMNIMYVTVNERVSEIGLRKAVGAHEHMIRRQFLAESVTITTLGGIIGVLLGIIITYIVSAVAQSLGFVWPAIFKIRFFVISVGVSALVGLLAGYLPAQRAAELDPIEALRK